MASAWSWPEIWQAYLWPLLVMVFQSVVLLVALLVIIAFLLLMDRKVWAAVQLRRGPNVVGPFGLLQSFADLLKFVLKEPLIPAGADKGVFLLAPLVASVLALAAWAVIPVNENSWGRWVISDLNVGILYLFAISSLGVYGIIMGGWASNSKYPFLGSLRSAAQMVSYEVSIGFVIITVLLCVGSLNLTDIVNAQKIGLGTRARPAELAARLVLAAAVPDVRRVLHLGAGRDQPAAVRPAGGGVGAGRRLHGRILLDALSAVHARRVRGHRHHVRADHHPVPGRLAAAGRRLRRSTWVPGVFWFLLKLVFVFFMFAMVKAFVPRYRYDQLMRLGWKVFLPLSLVMVVAVAAVLQFFELAP